MGISMKNFEMPKKLILDEATATPTAASSETPPGPSIGSTGSATVNFSGFASPDAQVTVLQNGQVATVVQAKNDASFSLDIVTGSGNQNFALYAQDRTGTRSSLNSVFVNITGNGSITVPPLLLAPTLQTSLTRVDRGTPVSFSGYSAPVSSIALTLTSNVGVNQNVTLETDSRGQYSYTLVTKNLPLGNYSLTTQSTFRGLTSILSRSIGFVVEPNAIALRPADGICSDFNKDSRVDLIDFSILIYWYNKADPPARVDCNNDHLVNLVDFSILMYNWTG